MTEKTETTKTDEQPKAESCCGSSAPKKDLSKYDYRHKEHGQEGTRRKGCC